MFLKLILFHQLVALSLANPFHKYPYVFLLDVGNEALENINTEKIRLSVPGGSVALKYPADGDSGTIIHVRVSGIDFGTDLKANIVEGGPGYNYVVLLFAGNAGVPYEAVVTVGTLRSDMTEGVKETGEQTGSNDSKVNITDGSSGVNSDDELNYVNSDKKSPIQETNANIYNYQSNDAENEVENDDESKDTQVNEKEIYNERPLDVSNAEDNTLNNEYIPDDKSYDGEQPRYENTNLYAQPQYNDFRSQSSEQTDQQGGTVDDVKAQAKEPGEEEPSEIDQMFNDEETHNNDSANKFQDANNNYAYADEQPAVDS